VAWRAASQHSARVPHMHQVTLSRSTSTLDRPHLKPRGGWLAQRAVAMSLSCGCCIPRGLARGQPTRCPRAAYASGHPVAEHLDTGQTTPQTSKWLACTEGCGYELELRVLHPTWPGARPADIVPVRRICIRSPLSRSTSTLDRPHLMPRCGWLAQRAVAQSLSCGCCTPRGLARGQPTRCPRAAYASGRPCRGAPRHWTDHTSSLEVVALHRGLWR